MYSTSNSPLSNQRHRYAFWFAIAVAICCFMPSNVFGYVTSRTINQSSNGQNISTTFTGLPLSATNVTVRIDVYGDYDQTTEVADVWLDNAPQTRITGGDRACSNNITTNRNRRFYTLNASAVADRTLIVRVDLSAQVQLICPRFTERVVITISYTARPDLYISSSTVPASGSTARPGTTFTVRYNVTNLFQAFTTNFYAYFYYCPSASTSGCTYLGRQSITDNFNQNQTRTYTSQTLTMPSVASYGTRYIRTFVDGLGAVTETSETNNNDFDSIFVSTRPDLYFSASTVPSSGRTDGPGNTFTGRYTIVNRANTSYVSNDFVVSYYYCPAASTTNCIFLRSQTITFNFTAGRTYTYTSTTLTMPSGATPTTRYIRAVIDTTNQVGESSETNNTDYDAITVRTSGTRPDLRVINTSAPYTGSTAGHASQFRVRYRVWNYGTAFTTNFSVQFYYCPSVSTSGCISLGTQAISNNFGAGTGIYFTSPTLTIPSGAEYGTRYIRFFVDSTSAVTELSETNNNTYDAISVTRRPDLYFSASTVPSAGNTDAPGSTFTGRYTIVNRTGTSRFTTDFSVSYYYCTTSTTNPSGCTFLRRQVITANFNSGSVYSYTSSVLTMPSNATAGTRYILARVDSLNNVTETSETNNYDSDSISVRWSSSRPDLRVDNTTAPQTGSTAGHNSSFTVRYRIWNNGAGAFTTNFYVRFYYCPGASTSGCITLGNQLITTNFGKNSAFFFTSPTLRIPSNAIYGTRYIRTQVDILNNVLESIESNNTDYDPISITTRPDLYVSASTVPSSGNTNAPGSKFRGRYTITNRSGTSYFSTNFTVQYYYCPAASTSGCTSLGSDTITNNFSAGESYSYTSREFTLPSNVASGTRYVLARVDFGRAVTESNENNNNDFDPISIGSIKPDLRMSFFNVTSSARGYRSNVVITYRVTNGGTANAGAFHIAFYYGDSTSTTGLTFLKDVQFLGGLARGVTSGQATLTVTLPANILVGTRYIHYYIDYKSAVSELSETNNRGRDNISITGTPNIQVSSVVLTPASQVANGNMTVTYRLYNAGYSRVNGTFYTRLYYSTNATISNADTYLGHNGATSTLNAGQTVTVTATIKVPSSAAPNTTRYIGAYADYDNRIANESSNTDNTRSRSFRVDSVDLVAVTITSNPTKQLGGKSITVTYDIKNNGSADVGAFKVSIYHSTNTTITTFDTQIDTFNVTALKKGANAKGTRTITLATSLPAGKAYLGIFVDSDTKIAESSETNNTKAVAFEVLVDKDKDGYANDVDCDDNDKNINPKAKEICDKKDNNCDGKTDEGCKCVDGQTQSCYAGSECVKQSDGTFKCKGLCKAGTQTCKSGAWGACVGEVKPTKEVCDNKDNNCDGQIDENLTQACYDGPTGTKGKGECKDGTQTCTAGKWGACQNSVKPAKEDCDGKDNDCDGNIDNKQGTTDALDRACKNTCGGTGTETCSTGKWQACSAPVCQEPTPEVTPGDAGTPEGGTTEGGGGDCYTNGCPAGQICSGGKCIANPCVGVTCPSGEYCRAGKCIAACGCTTCPTGQKCVDGACANAPCANANCTSGQVCNQTTGKCEADKCASITCGTGRTCADGKCVDDPCTNITCPTDMECKAGQCFGKTCSTPEGGTGETPTEQTADTSEPTTDASEPTTDTSEPTTDTSEPTADTSEPTTDTAEPTADTSEPSTPDTADTTDTGTPDTGSPDTGTPDTGTPDNNNVGGEAGSKADGGGGITNPTPSGGCCSIDPSNRGPLFFFFGLLLLLLPLVHRHGRKQQ